LSTVRPHLQTAISAVASDVMCNIVITGDQKGFMTRWKVGNITDTMDDPEEFREVGYISGSYCKYVRIVIIDSFTSCHAKLSIMM